MNDEEAAFRIVRLYFEEIARLGFKRSLTLDNMINAYFYTLKKLKNKDAALRVLADKLAKEGAQKQAPKSPAAPATSQAPVVASTTTTTSTTVTNNKQ